MSDNDTIPPESDDEIRARLQALAQDVMERTDTDAALERMPHRSRPPTVRLLAIAACLLAVVVLAAALASDPEPVDTVDQPPTTECPTTTQRRTITSGGQMNKRFAAPVAGAATAIMLISACSDDDGPTTLAKGDDIEFVGNDGFAGQTFDVDVEEQDGEVTGEFSINDVVFVRVDCANTDIDGYVILAGTVTDGDPTHVGDVGDLLAIAIEKGDPDRVWLAGNDDDRATSCTEMLESLPDDPSEGDFVTVEDGYDIQTG